MKVRTYFIGDTQQIVKLFYDTVPLEDAIAKYRAVKPLLLWRKRPAAWEEAWEINTEVTQLVP
jgi:hypothetical protein